MLGGARQSTGCVFVSRPCSCPWSLPSPSRPPQAPARLTKPNHRQGRNWELVGEFLVLRAHFADLVKMRHREVRGRPGTQSSALPWVQLGVGGNAETVRGPGPSPDGRRRASPTGLGRRALILLQPRASWETETSDPLRRGSSTPSPQDPVPPVQGLGLSLPSGKGLSLHAPPAPAQTEARRLSLSSGAWHGL